MCQEYTTHVSAARSQVDPAGFSSFQDHQDDNVGLVVGKNISGYNTNYLTVEVEIEIAAALIIQVQVIIGPTWKESKNAHMSVRMANRLNFGCTNWSVLNNGTRNMTVRKMLIYLEVPDVIFKQFHLQDKFR